MEERPGFEMDVYTSVTFACDLDLGKGAIGVLDRPTTSEEVELYAKDLEEHTEEISPDHKSTFFCVEDRKWLSVACITDPAELYSLAVEQSPGGITLTALFALLAANSDAIADGKNINQKAEVVAGWLDAAGLKNFVHGDCGALLGFANLGNNLISAKQAAAQLEKLGPVTDKDRSGLAVIVNNLEVATQSTGMPNSFRDFDHREFETHIRNNYPDYVTEVEVDYSDPKVPGGHKGSALYLPAPGKGLVKNRFIESTGRHAFTFTPRVAETLSSALAPGNGEEAHLLELAVKYQTLITGNGLFAPGMPIFAGAS